jgi:hypothetical protein
MCLCVGFEVTGSGTDTFRCFNTIYIVGLGNVSIFSKPFEANISQLNDLLAIVRSHSLLAGRESIN